MLSYGNCCTSRKTPNIIDFFNIYLQAQCWPNCVKILGEWFPERVRNSVFGMFGTCAFGGGIIGTALAVSMNFVI